MKWSDITDEEWDSWYKYVNNVIGTSSYDDAVLNNCIIGGYFFPTTEKVINSRYLQRVLALCCYYPELNNRIFVSNSKITPDIVYQYGYSLAHNEFSDSKEIRSLQSIVQKILSSISPIDVIDLHLCDLQEGELTYLTESTIFKYLMDMPQSIMLTLINKVSGPKDIIQILKKFVITKDETEFINCVLLNNISLDTIKEGCINFVLFDALQKAYSQSELDDNLDTVSDVFKTPLLRDEVFIQRFFTAISQGEDAIFDYFSSLQNDEIYDAYVTHIYSTIPIVARLLEVCPDYQLVKQYNELIEKEQFFKDILTEYEDINKLKELCKISFIIPIFEEFKRCYIADIELPPSCGVAKDEKMFFSGNKLPRESYMRKLYRELVDENLLSWDEETFFSFMYRMSREYKPSIEDTEARLKPIVWKGEPRDLFTLIFTFFEGDTKIWKKCGKFFVDTQGNPIVKGNKNMTKSITDLMKKILRNNSLR